VRELRLRRGGLELSFAGWTCLAGGRPVALDATAGPGELPRRHRRLAGEGMAARRLVVDGTLAGAHVAFDLGTPAATA
jgi:hypothetical protein